MDLEHYKQKLLRLKKELDNSSEALRSEFLDRDGNFNSGAELSVIDNHPADVATEVFMREHNMSQIAQDLDAISQVEHALIKIDKGGYGVCESCHEKISEERLELLPHARYCTDCRKSLEQVKPNRSLPTEVNALLQRGDGDKAETTDQFLEQVYSYGTGASPIDMGKNRDYRDEAAVDAFARLNHASVEIGNIEIDDFD